MNTSTATKESCDVLVVGAGPAGLSAALAAASRGAQVVVLDDNPRVGGQIWRGGPAVELPATAIELQRAVAATKSVRILNSTKVIGPLNDNTLLLEGPDAAIHMRWNKLIICTGARERLLPFPGWTLPGVTGAGGLQALIKGGMPVRGERIVIAGSGPLLLAAAATARKAGAHVLRIAEHAPLARVAGFAFQLPRWPSKLLQALQLQDNTYRTNTTVLSVQGSSKVESVTLQQGMRKLALDCDRVACGYGLVPNTALAESLGCGTQLQSGQGEQGDAVRVAAIQVDALQATTQTNIYAAGECTGIGGSERALALGRIAGYAAIGELQQAQSHAPERARWTAFAERANACFVLDESLKSLPTQDTLVCRCEDVSHGALQAHSSWTQAKIHTRCGMGACQGKVCGTAAQFLYGWKTPEARLPLTVARIGTLAATATPPTGD